MMLMEEEIVSCLNQYLIFNGGHQIYRFHQDVYRSPCQYHLISKINLRIRVSLFSLVYELEKELHAILNGR